MELQDIPSDFSSFMVGRHIVKDGSLYMVNRVDPLFFFLAAQEHHLQDQQTKKSWQPYEQCLEEASRNKSSSLFPKEIHAAITAEQLKHLCLTFENDEGIYFRFDATKALQFLKRKQERVLECLIRQDQIEQRRKDKLYELSFNQYNSGRASTSDNFTSTPSKSESDENETGENDQSNASSSPAVVISDTKALKLQSIQILCSYLSETWLEKFVEHLGVTMDQVQNKPSKVSAKNDTSSNSSTTPAAGYSIQKVIETENAEAATNAARVAAEKKTLESYRTPGNKRLAKVSTKGMKSIASFFGGAPKSKKAKHS